MKKTAIIILVIAAGLIAHSVYTELSFKAPVFKITPAVEQDMKHGDIVLPPVPCYDENGIQCKG